MTLGHVYIIACVLLFIVTLFTFWFAGMWWGTGVGIGSLVMAYVLYALGFLIRRRIDNQYKTT